MTMSQIWPTPVAPTGWPLDFNPPLVLMGRRPLMALHPASEKNPPGSVELGVGVPDLEKFYEQMSAKGVAFSMPPTKQDFGGMLAQFVDSEGGRVSVSTA